MARFPITVALIIVVTAFCGARVSAGSNDLRYTIDDQLRLGWIGSALIDPTGSLLVYERVRTYEGLVDFSIGRIGAWAGGGGEIVLHRLTGDRAEISLALDGAPARYWVDSFSPSGHYLSFVRVLNNRAQVGILDVSSGQLFFSDEAPRFDWASGLTATWAGDEFLFAALPRGNQPEALLLRSVTRELQKARWAAAKSGGGSGSALFSASRSHVLDGRLIEIATSTWSEHLLAEGRYAELGVSVDGKYLAAVREVAFATPSAEGVANPWLATRSVLDVIDLATGNRFPLPSSLTVFPGTLAWNPQETTLAIYGWPSGRSERDGNYFLWSAAQPREFTALAHAGLDLASEREWGGPQRPVSPAWLDDRIIVLARSQQSAVERGTFSWRSSDENARADWFELGGPTHVSLTATLPPPSGPILSSSQHHVDILAGGDVWRLQGGGVIGRLTSDGGFVFPANRLFGHAHPAKDANVALQSNTGAVVFVSDNGARTLEIPSSDRLLVGASHTSTAVLLRSAPTGVGLILQDGTLIDTINTNLSGIRASQWRQISYALPDGRDVIGCVLVPEGITLRQAPIIVDVYPGRQPSCLPPNSSLAEQVAPGPYSPQILASAGYVVFAPATPVNAVATPSGPLSQLLEVVQSGLDALERNQLGDTSRIGLFGFSQGAFAVLFLATQSKQFDGVVAINGWSDLISHYYQGFSNFNVGFPDEFPPIGEAWRYALPAGSEFSMNYTPVSSPELYTANSPILLAANIDVPVLIFHTDMDGFSLSQADQMFTALNIEGKDATLVRYFGEGHGPSSPANIRDMWSRILAFYSRSLRHRTETQAETPRR